MVWSGILYLLEVLKKVACNRANRITSYVSSGVSKSSSITCGCSWLVRFKSTEYDKCSNFNQVIITTICRVHLNICVLSYVDQFLLIRTRSSDCKNYADQSLREVMVQMTIEYFVSVRDVRELLYNIMHDRKCIDRHIY